MMAPIHLQYIKDANGKNFVVLTENEFEKMVEELEDIDDVRLYDEAKKRGRHKYILAE